MFWRRYVKTAAMPLVSDWGHTTIKQTDATVYPGQINFDNAAIDERCRQSWPEGSVCVCVCVCVCGGVCVSVCLSV